VIAYPSLLAAPENPDLVIIAVGAEKVPSVLEDCIAAQVRNVHIFSSGFGETGESARKDLENTVREIALRGGLNIVGPNAMGFIVPSSGLMMFPNIPLVDGPVGFISQSGTIAGEYLRYGPTHGIGFSKVISYGNALILDSVDFLEYFATDDETRIVCMYLEGIKDGRRLMSVAREIGHKKPIVVWKAGLTSPGKRAAASHTGSLTGDAQIWSAFFRQTGAISVGSIVEMTDVTMTFLSLKPSSRMGVAVLAAGGGPTVAAGDICAQEGLGCPELSPETQSGLREFIALVNQGLANPMDVPGILSEVSLLRRILAVLADDPGIDIVIVQIPSGAFTDWPPEWGEEFKESILQFNQQHSDRQPVVVALYDDKHAGNDAKVARELRELGITAYDSLRSACRALNRTRGYYEYLEAVNS